MRQFDHLAGLRRRIQALETRLPPAPWIHRTTYAIGGLEAVGFAEGTDVLLVVSTQGRGVFDCRTGERIARDRQDPYEGGWHDEVGLTALGIGPLAGQRIRVAGLYGGGLPTSTHDGWHLTLIAPEWPDYRVILSPPFKSIYDGLDVSVQVEADPELRAYGFSNTGASFVVATSSDVAIFGRTLSTST